MKNKRKIGAVAALGVVASLLTAGVASAAPGPANIDPEAKGSLTIHKFETPDPWAEEKNDSGLPITVPNEWKAVAGVEFTVQQVTALEDGTAVNLTTPAGWDAIDDLTATAAAGGTLAAVNGSPKTTGTDGLASFTDLPVGLYLVTETAKPANVTSTVAPFLVTVPTPIIKGGNGVDAWNYHVHAYPKNSVITVSKTVEELAQKALGEQIVWTLEGFVPLLGTGENHTLYEMIDTLPAQVTYNSSVVEFDGVATDAANYTVSAAGSNPVTMTLTPVGLAALKADSVERVTWKLTTTVNALATNGELTNNATLQANDSDKIPGTATQEWGGIEITKTAKDCFVSGRSIDTNDCTLQGAQFQLFKSQTDATNKTNPITVKQGSPAADVATFVTGENGKVTIDGVQVGTYWLVETKAPAGYILNSKPIEVEVIAGDMTSPVRVRVDNEQKPPTAMPPTGAVGAVALSILGVGALAAGVALSRKSKATQA